MVIVFLLSEPAPGGISRVAIDENPLISDRLNDSYSGYAGAIANSAVKAALILYCARAWDKAEDAVSLRSTIAELPDLDGLVKRRGIQLAALGVDFEDASTFTSRSRPRRSLPLRVSTCRDRSAIA